MASGERFVPGADAVSSWLSGSARDVVQARDVTGGIHIHPRESGVLPSPRQLPAEVSAFVGREREFELLQEWNRRGDAPGGVGLLLIMGTAGVGKTSLAVSFAHRVRAAYPDGQLFVNLRGYDPGPPMAPAAALERFLRAFGVPPAAIPADPEERAELYRTLLADRRVLILLDNAATVGQVRPLLPGGPDCLVLVTTRNRLSGLSAREGAHRITLGLLEPAEAVALVQDTTAPYRDPDPPEQVRELVDLCARLPLALRIVAERAAVRPLMPLRDLIADLRGESSLWSALSVEDTADADAVRSVFAWSYRALPPAAAKAFRRLGLHPGPEFGSAAAAALIGEDRRRSAALVDLLVGGHLLEQTASDRYQFHDLLRAYALSQVHSDESLEDQIATIQRMIEWYLHTAHAAVAAMQTMLPPVALSPPESPSLDIPAFDTSAQALDWYGTERANLAAVIRAAVEMGLATLAWQVAATLYPIQEAFGSLDEWAATAEQALAVARTLDDPAAEAASLYGLGTVHSARRRPAEAEACLSEAITLFTAIDDQNGILRAANALGLAHLRRRRLSEAVSMFEVNLDRAVRNGDRTWQAAALDNLGYTYEAMGLPAQASDHADQALRLYRDIGADARTLVDPLLTLARASRAAGDLEAAAAHLDDAAAIMEGDVVFRSLTFVLTLEQADQALLGGRHEQAMESYWRCVTLARESGDPSREAFALDGVGRALQAIGRAGEAVDFHQAAMTSAPGRLNDFERAQIASHLADALRLAGQPEAAQKVRDDAVRLLEPFDDPRAVALRTG